MSLILIVIIEHAVPIFYSLNLCYFVDCRYGHDHHGGGYGKGGGGGYDDHRKVDNEAKVHWVGRREGGGGGIIEHEKRGEREYQSTGSQVAEEYSHLGREAYKAGQREPGKEGEVYSSAQGPGYSYSHHNVMREEMEKGSPPRYDPHHSGGELLTPPPHPPPQYDLHGEESFPEHEPLTPSRR